MLISMTGYGRAECDLRNMVYAVEIKSLNSKQLDFSVKIPIFLKEKEMEIRSWLGGELKRGKIEVGIYQEIKEGAAGWSINRPVVEEYIRQLREIAEETGLADPEQLIQVAMRLPDTMLSEKDKLQEDDWTKVRASIQAALDDLNSFREQEGKALEKDIEQFHRSRPNGTGDDLLPGEDGYYRRESQAGKSLQIFHGNHRCCFPGRQKTGLHFPGNRQGDQYPRIKGLRNQYSATGGRDER
jgi:hypothetical protein